MLSRSSIMVLCFGRDLFPRVSLHEDLHTHSTHCMQIILKTRFQFPQWVMKNILFPKVITIFKLIYLFWFKMKQTLPGFCVTRYTSAFVSASLSVRFPGVVLLDNPFIPRHFQRLITEKLTGVNPGRPKIYKEERLKKQVDRNNPIKRQTVTSNESKKNSENNTQIIMAACTWPSNSNLSKTLKKAKYLKLRQLLSRWSVPTTFHGGIGSKLPTQTWNKAKISPHIPLKTTLFKRENHSTNDAFWLVESLDTHRLEKRENDRRTGFWARLHRTLFFLRWHSRLTEIWHFSRETSCSIYNLLGKGLTQEINGDGGSIWQVPGFSQFYYVEAWNLIILISG